MTGESIRAVGTSDDLADLAPLLWNYIECLEAFCRAEPLHPPWWFNERSNVSLLAAGAWRAGWLAIEEYGTRKSAAPTAVGGDAHTHGRCDLFLRRHGSSYAAEAKIAWQMLDDTRAPDTEVITQLIAARDDARKLFVREADQRLAICFCVPKIAVIDDLEAHVTGRLERWLASTVPGLPSIQASKRSESLFLHGQAKKRQTFAACFPKETRTSRGPGGKYCFPGVVVIVQEIKRGTLHRAPIT